MRAMRGRDWLGCLLLLFSFAAPVLSAEPPDDTQKALEKMETLLEEWLSTMTREEVKELFKDSDKPRKPMDAEALRRGYEGKPLEFLLAVRNGRVDLITTMMGELDFMGGVSRADAWGAWDDLADQSWRKEQPVEIYNLDFSASHLLGQAALQATVANDPAVWRALRPGLEKLVANTITAVTSTVMLVGAMREFESLLDKVDLDAPLITYRLSKTTTVHEPAVCFLTAGNSLKDSFLQAILRAGATPNVLCLDDRTPLAMAILGGNLGQVSLLLEHGANPYAKSRGFTPLQLVQASGLSESLKRGINQLLIEHGGGR